MAAVMKLLLLNEFTTNRSPFNMSILHQCFVVDSSKACDKLADLYWDLLQNAKEDYLRSLRAFLREFVRSCLRTDFSFSVFGRSLLNATKRNELDATVETVIKVRFEHI